jgi:hypothetical protein
MGPRIEFDHARGLGIVHAIEEAQLHRCAVLGEHAEVRATRDKPGAEREASALLLRGGGDHPVYSRVQTRDAILQEISESIPLAFTKARTCGDHTAATAQ